MNTAECCVNCEEPISGVPVYFDGDPFCCHGCVAGGPCVCTYQPEPAHPAPVTARARSVAPALHLATPVAQVAHVTPLAPSATPDPRAPIPFRRAASAIIVLHVVGMPDQRDLLRFAGALDSTTGLADVALTRVEGNEAWFTARAVSVETLAAMVVSLPGYNIQVSVAPDSVEAIVLSAPAAAAPTTAPAVESVPPSPMRPEERRDDTLLPPRPRFRVFRPATEAAPAAAPDGLPPQPIARPAAPQPLPDRGGTQPVPPTGPALVPPPAPAPSRPAVARITTMQPVEVPQPVAPAAPFMVPEPPAAQPAPPTPAPAAPRLEETARVREPEPRPVTPATQVMQASEDVVAPDARPGGAISVTEHLTLVVYPFHSFVALNEFQAAVRGLRGISGTRVRRFYRGTLHLAVDYEDIIPLSERLQDLRGVSFRIVNESRQEIELVLEESRSLVAAGEG